MATGLFETDHSIKFLMLWLLNSESPIGVEADCPRMNQAFVKFTKRRPSKKRIHPTVKSRLRIMYTLGWVKRQRVSNDVSWVYCYRLTTEGKSIASYLVHIGETLGEE